MLKKERFKYLYKTKYLSLCETNHKFIFAQRRNINSTASLCFKKVQNTFLFLIRYQPLPLVNTIYRQKWNDRFACPITGSLEIKQSPIENAINEIYEEANIIVNKSNLIDSCFNVATTQMNEIVYCFLFNVTNCKIVNKKMGDGTIFEKNSKNKWLTLSQLQKIIKNNHKAIYLSSLLSCLNLFQINYGKIKNKY